MIRALIGVIIGYLVMVIVMFTTFTISYLLLGADKTFQAESFKVTGLWLTVSLALSFLVAIVAGKVCRVVGGGLLAVLGLVVLVGVLGVLSAAYQIVAAAGSAPVPRTGSTSNLQAMMNARQPVSIALLLPIINVVGVLVGGKKKKT